MFDVILASSPGLRYGAHPTICPSLMREVTWLMAAIVVHASNIASWAGRGTLWKWSYTHSESKPSSSASRVTSTAFAHFACGSSMEASSIFQPWGTKTPKVRSSEAMRPSFPSDRVDDRTRGLDTTTRFDVSLGRGRTAGGRGPEPAGVPAAGRPRPPLAAAGRAGPQRSFGPRAHRAGGLAPEPRLVPPRQAPRR